VSDAKKYYWDVLARGYCHPENSHKTMDPDLVMAMAEELVKADEDGKLFDKYIKEIRESRLK